MNSIDPEMLSEEYDALAERYDNLLSDTGEDLREFLLALRKPNRMHATLVFNRLLARTSVNMNMTLEDLS